jgi:hypothetical protein
VRAAELTIEDSLAANNSNYGIVVFAGVGRVSNCTVTDNTRGLSRFDGTLESRGNNTVRGNGMDTVGTITAITGS